MKITFFGSLSFRWRRKGKLTWEELDTFLNNVEASLKDIGYLQKWVKNSSCVFCHVTRRKCSHVSMEGHFIHTFHIEKCICGRKWPCFLAPPDASSRGRMVSDTPISLLNALERQHLDMVRQGNIARGEHSDYYSRG